MLTMVTPVTAKTACWWCPRARRILVPALGFEPRHYASFEDGPSAVGVGRRGTPERTRTPTDHVLSVVPLPLGYGSAESPGVEPGRVTLYLISSQAA